MIEHFCQPVFRAWLENTMTAGDVPIPIDKYGKFADNIVFRGRVLPGSIRKEKSMLT